jgi:amino acid transporter
MARSPAKGSGMSTAERGGADYVDDRAQLHKLGYAQELYRSMGGFQNFAISFTIISILAGCLTSYYIAFQWGGPVAVTWGWLLVGGFCIIVSLAMGEIASTYPTAGGLYYWASKLGSPAWGWFTGWFNLIGQIAVTAAIGYGLAIFATAFLNLMWSYPTSTNWIFVTYSAVMLIAVLINIFRVQVTGLLNTISAWWHMAGVIVIVAVLLIVPDHHQSLGYAFGQTINNSGFSGSGFGDFMFLYVFGIGLLMAQYTITGFDASAHMSEETRQASRSAAIGMIMSVVVSVVFGFILLLAVTLAIPDTQGVIDAGGFAVTYIWQTSLGTGWAKFLLFIVVLAQMFCLTASVTSASRMMYAFSRDGAVPGHRIWRRISRDRVPIYSVLAISLLSWLLMVPTLKNAVVGYLVGTSIAVIGLYIAFGIPVYLRWRAGESFERGAWHLGNKYKWIDLLAVGWIILICILFMLPIAPAGVPWDKAFDWNVVNYAPLTVGGAFLLFGGWYVLSAHKWFKGPVRQGDETDLERIEREYDSPSAAAAPTAGA